MRISRLLFICIVIVGCSGQTKHDNKAKADSVKFPLLIDSGRKVVYQTEWVNADNVREPYFDTVSLKGKLYRQDSIRNPLRQFRLSYPEWETIKCIVALDEDDYNDKAMIALIEKTGDIRISYKSKTLRLGPTVPVKMGEEKLTGTFKSDSLEIQISGQLDKRGSESLRGQGTLIFRTPTKTINEKIYLVYRLK